MDDPRRIGDYRLLGVLGAGGMGRVYLGRNAGGRTVAVKVIRPDLIGDGEFRARFRREVTAARRVGGQFTAPVLDADVDANPPWLATGYVAGFSLTDAVERFGTFTEDALLVLARGLAEALAAIHAAGVVHRDLKPSNVLLALDGPKVIDFGIARAVEDTALTTTGKVIGSPGFMCPEQVTGEPVVPASDIFALGGVLVFAATGQGPFGVGETVHMLWRVVYEEPRLAAVPERVRPLIAACLAKDARERPTPRQLLDQLAELGVPERGGWLPTPVLEEVSRRAVQLLDLDSGPHDLPEHIGTPTATTGSVPHTPPPTSAPHYPTMPGYPGSPGRAPGVSEQTSGHAHSGWQPVSGFGPGSPQPNASVSGPTRAWQTPGSTPPPDMPSHGRPQPGWPPGAGSEPAAFAGTHTPTPPPKNRTRVALLAGLAVTAIVVAIAAFFVGSQLRGSSTGDTGGKAGETAASASAGGPAATSKPISTGTTTPEPTSTGTAASGTSVPKAFVGEWRGTANDGLVSFDIQLTIREGKVGEEVATSSNTGKLSGSRCARIEKLTAATDTRITFQARLDSANSSGTDCTDDGAVSTVTLQGDGAVVYSTPGLFGGTISGTLRKS